MSQFARKTFQRGGFNTSVLATSVGMKVQLENTTAGKLMDGIGRESVISDEVKKLAPGALVAAGDVAAYRSGKAKLIPACGPKGQENLQKHRAYEELSISVEQCPDLE